LPALKQFARQAWLRPLVTLLFVVILATVFSPRTPEGVLLFWKTANLANVMGQIAVIGILAMGMTLVIVSGGIDLSVGSLLAVSGTLFAYTFGVKEWPAAVAVSIALGGTALFGLINGLLITRLRIQPFIVTLAAMIGSRGFARWLVDNANIDIGFGDDHIGRVVNFLGERTTMVPTFLVVTVLCALLLNGTRFGRYCFAVGGSEEAARLTGIAINWVKIRVYLLCGFLAGVAGILHCCKTHQGSPNAGVAYELDAIAAAVIGGTSLAGGKGGILGTLVGALVLGILANMLRLNNVDENVQWMLKAAIIIVAVWLQLLGTRKTT
jgi:ribose transport system permease protein